jgi:hypothetical protein
LKPVMVRLSVIVPLLTLRLKVLVDVWPFGRVVVIERLTLPPPLLAVVTVRLQPRGPSRSSFSHQREVREELRQQPR